MAFSWVPFYRELAGKVLEFEDKQDELLEVFAQMREKDFFGGTTKTMDAVDPFTFFAVLNVLGEERRSLACSEFALLWNMKTEVPTDFAGVPEITALNCWFFPYASARKDDDIAVLWKTARAVYNSPPEELDSQLLARCLQIRTVKLAKMTIGFFYLNPQQYLPVERQMRSFYERNSLPLDLKNLESGDWSSYVQFIKHAHETLGDDFPQISSTAWRSRNDAAKINETIVETTMPNFPLNQILYGPPGTGKTFNVVRRAVQIIEPGFNGDFKKRFETLRATGKIGFVTFHQSFSYEEFIEGLRPIIDKQDGSARYEIKDGVLKELAVRAIFDALSLNLDYDSIFEKMWSDFRAKIKGDPTWRLEGAKRETGTIQSRFKLDLPDTGNIKGTNELSPKSPQPTYQAQKEYVKQIWMEFQDKPVRAGLVNDIIGKGSASSLIAAIAEGIKQFAEEEEASPTQIVKSWLAGKRHDDLSQNPSRFVLIIDEINRGNISKILGELITLLEDDKRLGKEPNELRLTLPVSGETFALPSNLFILGTMNTADRSLAQLDVALRRRFSFIEMAPDFGVCDGMPADIKKVLEKLNERIEWAIDREHRLGHASWMGVENAGDFNRVWSEKAMPLLVELFADNLEGLRDVLGDSDNQNGFVRPFKAPGNMKGRDRLRLYLDCDGAASFDALSTLKRNLGVD